MNIILTFANLPYIWLYNWTPQHDLGLGANQIVLWYQIELHLCPTKIFRCLTYALDPNLQDDTKIPKWSPRYWLFGQYFGFMKLHSSLIGLICNLCTNHVSAQLHDAYDQLYSTVYGGLLGAIHVKRLPVEI